VAGCSCIMGTVGTWGKRRPGTMEAGLTVLALVGLAACTDTRRPDPPPGLTGPTTEQQCRPPTVGGGRPGLDSTVKVFLYCDAHGGVMPVKLHVVDRIVPDDGQPLRAAVTQLLLGVTPSEAEAGLGSAFSSFTAGGLRDATVRSGTATLDLTDGFESTNNFSTTNMSGVVLSQIKATVFQFPSVHGIQLLIKGERWCGWEAGHCGPGPLLKR
jgi:hypothetical protein